MKPDTTGWETCEQLDAPSGIVTNPDHAVGLIRRHPNGLLVTRTWLASGEPRALHDGVGHFDFDGNVIKDANTGFVLADEPGAAWLAGALPLKPLGMPRVKEGELDLYPYSGVKNVLLANNIKGLLAGAVWATQPKQMRRFGGMPVVSFVDPISLELVNWREVTVRCSDKTWELCSKHMPFEVLREGLR